MKRIGLLSDTHGYLDPRIMDFFDDADEIWHAGDIGSLTVLEELQAKKKTRAVYGNADSFDIRRALSPGPKVIFSEDGEEEDKEKLPDGYLHFTVENVNVLMTHIGGYPGKYNRTAAQWIKKLHPTIFVAGHSHILKVMFDKANNCLHINPGACGHYGIHSKRTAVKFVIDGETIKDFDILELGETTGTA